jgi:signal transduction histidine kinase
VTVPSPRFLVIAPVGRDGDLICALLKSAGYAAECLNNIKAAENVESSQLLGMVLTDEALVQEGFGSLRVVIQSQPVWSDLPILVLTSGTTTSQYGAIASQVRSEFRSIFLLDRPVRKELFLSAAQVAYNSRLKQFEVRDALTRQYLADETLRNTEKLAVAGQLAATMAHEVNNPLEALTNLLFLVENCTAVEEARSFGHLAAQEVSRISEIVNQTLRFHRAPAKPAFTDLGELATSAVALFQGRLRKRNITSSVDAKQTYAFCSAGEIRQALVNLIGNAIDATPDGGRLRLRVTACSRKDFHYARISIADSGVGISDEIRPKIFTQFFTTKGTSGTGIGLWLTRDIVVRNGGRLRYRSRTRAPSGTVFTMYLPSLPPLEIVRPSVPSVHARAA